ncbi:unnamed protein product [Cuscuta epithymum]|uniref:Uncharacterized protein n=1 Tax=Cuscuta epithymum TaxID=186058 RepID=A0AAV0F6P9_9ASTE|nr:unnamed protein product [Cuscuta epithymum]CAH9131176.1 unnamed protein product [Cuscuta epithymum]
MFKEVLEFYALIYGYSCTHLNVTVLDHPDAIQNIYGPQYMLQEFVDMRFTQMDMVDKEHNKVHGDDDDVGGNDGDDDGDAPVDADGYSDGDVDDDYDKQSSLSNNFSF